MSVLDMDMVKCSGALTQTPMKLTQKDYLHIIDYHIYHSLKDVAASHFQQ
jgi:hypothetical protein